MPGSTLCEFLKIQSANIVKFVTSMKKEKLNMSFFNMSQMTNRLNWIKQRHL